MRSAFLSLFIPLTAICCLGFNHPEIEWKTVKTENFLINYYDRTETAVYPTWKIAEEVYAAVAQLYNYEPKEKIAIALAEYDDYTNGFAEWTAGNIMIWLPDSRFDLRSNTTWLRNVITHELVHILSLEKKKRLQVLSINFSLSLSTPNEHISLREPFSRITMFPMWLVEGITQFETERLGNDCYDSRREMVLRCAVLSKSVLSFEEMGYFNHDNIGSELVYNQGFAFTRYINGKIGTRHLQEVFISGASEKINLEEHFSSKTGLSLRSLYHTWIDSLQATWETAFDFESTENTILYSNGRFNLLPKISPDGRYRSWLSSMNDDGGRTDLLIARSGETRPFRRIPYVHTAQCYSASSETLYYVKSRRPNRSGSYFNDIFAVELPGGRQQRITSNGRIYDIAATPGGDDLLCIAFRNGVYGLFRCDTRYGHLTEIIPGEQGNPMVNICTHPSDSTLSVFSKIINGRSRLFLMSIKAGRYAPLSPGGAQEESPFWAEDGRIYYSADYDGVFNIYSILPDGSDLKRHTRTAGGYFSPCIAPDGKPLASRYSASGFSIVRFTPSVDPYSPPDNYRCSFQPLPQPRGKVTIKSRSYSADFRRSTLELNFFGTGIRNSSLLTGQHSADADTSHYFFGGGLTSYKSDALKKRHRLIDLTVGAYARSAEEPDNTFSITRDHRLFTTHYKTGRPVLPNRSSLSVSHSGHPLPDFRNTVAVTDQIYGNRSGTRQTEASDSGSSTEQPPFILFLRPYAMFQNQFGAPTIGIEMSAETDILFRPGIIELTPYLEFQLAREWFIGTRVQLLSMPFANFPLFGSLPVSLSWSHPGYYNEDFSYNYADYSQLNFSAGPVFNPYLQITTAGELSDTVSYVVNGWRADMLLFRGIPLFKYGSLQLISYTIATYHRKKITDELLFDESGAADPVLEGSANSYLLFSNGIRCNVPIVRTINRGSSSYFDALYGYFGYNLNCYTNNHFFNADYTLNRRMFTDYRQQNGTIFIDHTLSAGVELGQYTSHMFFKKHIFTINYQLLRKLVSLSLSSGF